MMNKKITIRPEHKKGILTMTYPYGIIRDLLPLYIDEVCNEDSKQAVFGEERFKMQLTVSF